MQTVIRAGSVIDGTGRDPIRNATITIDGGRIIGVDTGSAYQRRDGDEVLDCRHLTLLPGFIDAHVHLNFNAGPTNEDVIETLGRESEAQLALRAIGNAQDALRAGVTTVRDCGGRGLVTFSVRDAVAGGLMTGPRILVCGMPITTTLGHCHYCGLVADGTEAARSAAQAMCEAGADFVKVMASGGMMTATSDPLRPQYSLESLQAIVGVARGFRRPVAAHALNTETVRRAVDAGVDTIEHCLWQAPDWSFEPDEEVITKIASRRIYVGSTSSGIVRAMMPDPADTPDVQAEKRAAFAKRFQGERLMRSMGVPILIHTDAGVRHTPFREFGQAIECGAAGIGLTPVEAIRAVTQIPAEALGLGHDVGTIEPGKRADLIAVEGDVVSDLTAVRRVRGVWRDGQMVVADGNLTLGRLSW
jgi:imidazolonepropionase-like amidohydrolase